MMSRCMWFACVGLCLIILNDKVFAQDIDKKREFSIARLKEQPVTYIDERNVSAFDSLLLPEVKKIISETPEVIEAVASMTTNVIHGEAQPVTELDVLSSDIEKLPFLPGGKIVEIQAPRAGDKILWNALSRFYEYPIQSAHFTYVSSIKDDSTTVLKGEYKKIYPARLPEPPSIRQFFREAIRITEPSSIALYGWLTFRFFGADEDFVQVYSPFIKKTRQVTGTNRSDSAFRGMLTLDDLDIAKPEFVQVTLKEKTTLLVPYLQEGAVSFSTQGSCITGTSAHEDTTSLFSRKASWSPRSVFVLELTQKDPFSTVGRSVMYVDSESFIPYFRTVFTRDGEENKLVVYGFSSNQGEGLFPYRVNLISHSMLKSESYSIDSVELCRAFKEGQTLSDFDPKKLLEAP